MSIPQEPYVDRFKNKTISEKFNTTYTDFLREASLKRYALHQYQYSYIHKASTDGIIYFKPMFYNFPGDENNYKDVEKNILLGDSVKLSVVVDEKTADEKTTDEKTTDEKTTDEKTTDEKNITNLNETFYFPGNDTKWCPIWPKYNTDCYDGKNYQTIEVKYDEMLVHIKSGSIIPLQLTSFTLIEDNEHDYKGYENKLIDISNDYSIDTLKKHTLDLAVMCDNKNHAEGWVRFDDGLSKDLSLYTEYSFTADITSEDETEKLNIVVTSTKDEFKQPEGSKNQKLGSILIYEAKSLNYTDESKCSITFSDDKEDKENKEDKVDKVVEAKPFCYFIGDDQSSICRFMVKDNDEPDLKDIKSITLTK